MVGITVTLALSVRAPPFASPKGASSGSTQEVQVPFTTPFFIMLLPEPTSKVMKLKDVVGRVFLYVFFLCQMLLIFRAPPFFFSFLSFTKSHPQVLHIWLVKNGLEFLPRNPTSVPSDIYFLLLFYFLWFIFVRFAVKRDFE